MSTIEFKRKWLNVLWGAFVTVFLGAVGSAVWEYLRDPVIYCFSSAALLMDKLSGTYLDSLHASIGKARQNEMLIQLGIAFPVIVIAINAVGFFSVIKLRRKIHRLDSEGPMSVESSNPKPMSSFVLGKPFIAMVAVTVALNILMYSNDLFAGSYRLGAVTWIERSIEIVRPKISESEFLQLRADFRSVEDANSFYKVRASLIRHAQAHRINLPEHNAIGDSSRVPHFSGNDASPVRGEK